MVGIPGKFLMKNCDGTMEIGDFWSRKHQETSYLLTPVWCQGGVRHLKKKHKMQGPKDKLPIK